MLLSLPKIDAGSQSEFGNSMLPISTSNLSGVPKPYHDLSEVFSNDKVLSLPPPLAL